MQEATKEIGVDAINPLLSPGDQHWLEPHKTSIFPGGQEKRNAMSDIPWPGGEICEAVDGNGLRRMGEKRDGPDPMIAEMICRQMINGDGKCSKLLTLQPE